MTFLDSAARKAIDANFQCPGCDVPMDERVVLPKDWKEGDKLPDNLTVHYEGYNGTGRQFALRGNDTWATERVYLPKLCRCCGKPARPAALTPADLATPTKLGKQVYKGLLLLLIVCVLAWYLFAWAVIS